MPVLTPLIALIAALIVRTDRLIVRELLEGGATTQERAIKLHTWRLRQFRLHRLAGAGAVHVAEGDRYYLDEAGWARYRRMRLRRVLTVLICLFVVSALIGLCLMLR